MYVCKRRSKRRVNLPAEEICYLDWSPVSSPYLNKKIRRETGGVWRTHEAIFSWETDDPVP